MNALDSSLPRGMPGSTMLAIWRILLFLIAVPKSWVATHIRRQRVPVLLQLNATECGAACLAMVLGFHGRLTRVAEVRELTGVGRDGLSAATVVKAATQYGLRMKAF